MNLTLEQVRRLKFQVARERAKRSLTAWCQYVDPRYEVARHHAKLIEALERVERGELKRLIITMPPRHGKSLTTSVRFPAWFLGRNPDAKVIISSYAASLAQKEFSRRARNEFEAYAPEVFGLHTDTRSNSVSQWNVNGHEGVLYATGVDGGVTGKGADVIIVDDPVKGAKEAESEVVRETVKHWYQLDLSTRLQPGSRWGAIIVVMTRWHEADLAGFLLNEAKLGGEKWEVLEFPMLDETVSPPAILWPERYSMQDVEAIKQRSGSRGWQSLFQGRPVASEGGMFKRHWWRFWDHTEHEGVVKIPQLWQMELIQSWDMAFKETKTSDFVVGTVWAKFEAQYFLLDLVRGRMDLPKTLAAVEALSEKWPQATLKLVEDKANGPAVIQMLHNRLEGLVAVNPEGGKEARGAGVSPLVEAGNVYLPVRRLAPWVDEFLDEASSFPLGTHDDQVDSMTQALLRLMGQEDTYKYRLPASKPRLQAM